MAEEEFIRELEIEGEKRVFEVPEFLPQNVHLLNQPPFNLLPEAKIIPDDFFVDGAGDMAWADLLRVVALKGKEGHPEEFTDFRRLGRSKAAYMTRMWEMIEGKYKQASPGKFAPGQEVVRHLNQWLDQFPHAREYIRQRWDPMSGDNNFKDDGTRRGDMGKVKTLTYGAYLGYQEQVQVGSKWIGLELDLEALDFSSPERVRDVMDATGVKPINKKYRLAVRSQAMQ